MDTSATTGSLLAHLAFVLGRQTDQTLQEQLGIGLSQYKILTMIADSPLVQQRDIAASFGQTEASISRQVKLLRQKGLLMVRINPKNRRQHLSVLTSKGEQLAQAAQKTFEQAHGQTLEALGDKQRSQLQNLLIALHEQTCQSGKTAACDSLTQIWQRAP